MKKKEGTTTIIPIIRDIVVLAETYAKSSIIQKGGKKYGGEFKFMSTEKIQTLYPTFTVDVYSMRLISQIYESLLTVNPETGKLQKL